MFSAGDCSNSVTQIMFNTAIKDILVAVFCDQDGCRIAMFVKFMGSDTEYSLEQVMTPDCFCEEELRYIQDMLRLEWQAELVLYRPLE